MQTNKKNKSNYKINYIGKGIYKLNKINKTCVFYCYKSNYDTDDLKTLKENEVFIYIEKNENGYQYNPIK